MGRSETSIILWTPLDDDRGPFLSLTPFLPSSPFHPNSFLNNNNMQYVDLDSSTPPSSFNEALWVRRFESIQRQELT